MHLIQLLLPVRDNDGRQFAAELYQAVRSELAERFGGLTAYSRAPAEGLWKDEDGHAARDEVIVYEVMVDSLDHAWWRDYRAGLERRFEQEELVVRAQSFERL